MCGRRLTFLLGGAELLDSVVDLGLTLRNCRGVFEVAVPFCVPHVRVLSALSSLTSVPPRL